MKRPNILFLFPDQHRREWFPYTADIFTQWGMQKLDLKLPNIEFIQSRGVTFLNAITPSPLCAPARACLATGTDYTNCATYNNGYDMPVDMPTIYSALSNNGYAVCGVGKFDLEKKSCNWFDSETRKAWGFTKAIDNEGKLDAIRFTKQRGEPAGPYMKHLDTNKQMQTHLDDMFERKNKTHTTPLADEFYCDNWLTQNAVDLISDIPVGEPWFIQVNFTGPHSPFDITKRMRETVENRTYELAVNNTDPLNEEVRKNYAAMIENIDRNIGILIDLVKERGELENTVIVYAADHGDMLGDHGRYSKGVALRGSLNIPMIVALPNAQRIGEFDSSIVELQDLTKTFADIAGVDYACEHSISLIDIVQGKTTSHRDFATSALYHKESGFRCIVDNSYKYIETRQGEKLLYDMQADIWECDNIATNNADIVQAYSEKLDTKVKFFDV